jgi:hypothetical protein
VQIVNLLNKEKKSKDTFTSHTKMEGPSYEKNKPNKTMAWKLHMRL